MKSKFCSKNAEKVKNNFFVIVGRALFLALVGGSPSNLTLKYHSFKNIPKL
jgi:hypothetical protein